MTIEQLSIFVENKAGRMAEIAAILAEADIDIRALSLADTSSYGILRLIVDKPAAAAAALREHGLSFSINQVLAVRMADRPGGFAGVLRVLAEGAVNVEYLYAFLGRDAGSAIVILRVEDNAQAASLLRAGGIGTLSADEVFGSGA